MSAEKLPHHPPGLLGLLEHLEWLRKKYASRARSSHGEWNEDHFRAIRDRFQEWKTELEDLMAGASEELMDDEQSVHVCDRHDSGD